MKTISRLNGRGCRALTDNEFESLLAGMNGRHRQRNRLLFLVLRYTGFRISEGLSLKVKDIWDHENGKIKESITVAKAFTKGGKRSRTMPVHPRLNEELWRYVVTNNLNYVGFSDWPLFCRQGRPVAITPAMAWEVLQSSGKAVGVDLKHLGTHSCRKTFASAMYHHPRIAGNLLKVAQLLGHDDVQNTVRYIEFLDDSLERAVLDQ